MKKLFAVSLACVVLAGGCASSAQMRHVEDKEAASQKTLRETDQRLRTLEQSVATLDSQMAQLKNRTFEVRTRGGQKTSMTVVPILPPAPLPVPPAAGRSSAGPNGASTAEVSSANPPQREVPLGQNGSSVVTAPASGSGTPAASIPSPALVAKESQSAATAPASKGAQSATPLPAPTNSPKGRVIDPATQPTSFPTATPAATPQTAVTPSASASSSAGRTVTAGPTGKVGNPGKSSPPVSGTGAANVGLPPVAAPEPAVPPVVNPTNFAAQDVDQPVVPASSGKSDPAGGNATVPVPALPPSALALPPEHPGLPPVEAASPAATSLAPVTQATSRAVTPAETKPVEAVNAATTNLAPQQAAKPTKNEKAAYEAALKVMTAGRSAEGISRFEAFLQEYPQGGYAANAEYWIGEGFYAQGKYQDALNQFRKVDASYPQHHKNADALLKTGMCLSRLGDKDAATQAYKQLLTRFPNSEAARIARSRGLAR